MIRWITDRLGTAAWTQGRETPGVYLLDVRDLVDKRGNRPLAIRSKIDEGVRSLQRGEKLLICCDYGISRSNAIAAGILAEYASLSVDEAVSRVVAATGEASVKLEMLSAVRGALRSEQHERPPAENTRRHLLMTGASGFIGASLLGSLQRRNDIVVPARSEIDLARDLVKLDLLAKERSVDTVLHLANPRVYTSNESMGIAITMLKNILDLCSENGLSLIYLSGWEIYSGYKANELLADEALPPCPGSTYGQTKLLCENLIDHYHRHHGLRYTLLRPSPVFGPGSERPRFIWRFVNEARQDEDIVAHRYLNGLPALDLLYVDDLCRAISTAIELEPQGVFNLGSGMATSTTDVAYRIIERVGSRSQVRHLDVDTYTSNIVMDFSRATAQLGWAPTTTLAQGLDAIIGTALSREPQQRCDTSMDSDRG